MRAPEFAAYIHPARQYPELWRILLGILLTLFIYLACFALMLVVFVLGWFYLRYTSGGRSLYAIGGNPARRPFPDQPPGLVARGVRQRTSQMNGRRGGQPPDRTRLTGRLVL